MRAFWDKFDSSDIAAYMIIIICALLLWHGLNGEVKSILALAAGWAFRRPIANGIAKVNNKSKGDEN